jgi:hypothetical protein
MPPLIPGRAGRQVQALAGPANLARALALQQQGGSSGTPPLVADDPALAPQVAHTTGVIPAYPATAPSPNGDQVSGVGIQVLNNAGNPVMVAGNLAATQTSATDLPADFTDGGFAFVDANGNLVAGYSQETGLWGFGGAGASPVRYFGSVQLLGGDDLEDAFEIVIMNDDVSDSSLPNLHVWRAPYQTLAAGAAINNFSVQLPFPPATMTTYVNIEVGVTDLAGANARGAYGSISATSATGFAGPSYFGMTYYGDTGADLTFDATTGLFTTTAGGVYAYQLGINAYFY